MSNFIETLFHHNVVRLLRNDSPTDISPFVTSIIILNFIVLILGAFPSISSSYAQLFFWLDYMCVWVFLFEAMFKIKTFGWQQYIKSYLNKFDFVIVLASLPCIAAPIIATSDLSLVLLLRTARLIRFFKILQFVPNSEHLLKGIFRALKASIGVFTGLLFILIVASVSGTMMFGTIAPEIFGNPFLSAYSMFQVFTVEGWFEIPDLLISHNNSVLWAFFVRSYFISFVVIGGLIGLSILNAVFVDALVADNTDHLEEKIDKITQSIKNIERSLSDQNRQN